MTLKAVVVASLVCAAFGVAPFGACQTAVGPGGPIPGASSSEGAAMSGENLLRARLPRDFGPLATDDEGRAILRQIEAKWGTLMRDVFEWDASSFQQFYEGYKNYPVSVLERARAARTYEAMEAALATYAAAVAQRNAGLAFDYRKTTADDLGPDAIALRKAATKALGDSAKDLIFIPTTPCTVWDTRFAAGPPYAGIIGDGVTRAFFSHLLGAGTNFLIYGGNPSCSENNQTFLGQSPYAVLMIVYVSNATGNGWLTFYRFGDPDPSAATISVYYSPGPTRTQSVVTKSKRGYGAGLYDISVTGRFASADASASVIGYFLKPEATELDCVTNTAALPLGAGVGTSVAATVQCDDGYVLTGVAAHESANVGNTIIINKLDFSLAGAFCRVTNNTGSAQNAVCKARCCRVPGH